MNHDDEPTISIVIVNNVIDSNSFLVILIGLMIFVSIFMNIFLYETPNTNHDNDNGKLINLTNANSESQQKH